MVLTTEERRTINKQNAAKSTGPKSPEGKKAAAKNSYKHGLRAEAFALPGEDLLELARLTDDWLDFYTTALRLFPVQWGVADGEYPPVPDKLLLGQRPWNPLPRVSAWTPSNGNACARALISNGITGSRAVC